MANYIITGGLGFVGTNLINKILENKFNKIINFDCYNYSSNKYYLKDSKNYRLFKINLANKNSILKIKKIIKFFKPKYFIHLAADTHVDRSIKSTSKFIENNIHSTINILDILKDIKKKIKLIYVGTDEVYGDLGKSKKKFNSSSPLDPKNPYSASKASSINFIKAYGSTFNINYIIINPSNLYGPFQYPEKLIPKNIMIFLKKKKMHLYGSGNNFRSWLYISDFIDALQIILKKGKVFKTYLPCSEKYYSNKYILEKILKIANIRRKKFKFYITKVKDRKGHDHKYFSNNKDVKILGWRNKKSLTNGLKLTYQWYLNKKNIKFFKKINLSLQT
jgi:dTDP-glucose 4,6-dehydratase